MPELVERVLDLLRHVVPSLALLVGRLEVVVDVLEVDVDVAAPLGIGFDSKMRKASRRKSRIQPGSPFISEI